MELYIHNTNVVKYSNNFNAADLLFAPAREGGIFFRKLSANPHKWAQTKNHRIHICYHRWTQIILDRYSQTQQPFLRERRPFLLQHGSFLACKKLTGGAKDHYDETWKALQVKKTIFAIT